MSKKVYIDGMMCNMCVKHVTEALNGIDGVTGAKVSLEDKNAVIETSKEVSDKAVKDAVGDAGYDVVKIEEI